ncbi:uncharacterized protein LOC114387710 [Glycine soja]|uniref:Transmembrane protein n=1 Tax=Glycine soja TaxID=3848 RepID=A0A445GWG3_GLYSO|nr:uncharacterized protein LOC114387710 [Glycine soja]RZB65586.1 hypothetical protein D0Y65_041593 [Glycine soja]
METLWDLEDKLKVSTLGAILLLACASFALLLWLCIAIILRRKAINNNKIVHQEGAIDDENENVTSITNTITTITTTTTPTEWSEPSCVGWISVKRVLMGSMLWSKASKLEENIAWQRERGSPLLGLQRQGPDSGWQSHNSESPVWQRPILRGEKCELPRFSGLILYDEKGKLLRDSEDETHFMETSPQEIGNVTVRTTLKDLL